MIENVVLAMRRQVVLTPADRIKKALRKINGRRRKRTLTFENLKEILSDMLDGSDREWAMIHGGVVAKSYNYPASSTIALAHRHEGDFWLAITEVDAHWDRSSAGNAWSCLSPWVKAEGPRGQADLKWASWRQQYAMMISTEEARAIIES